METSPPRSAWIKGPDFPCAPRPFSARPLRVVMLGAPGVGKGTQSELLAARHGACQLSTGDIFRAAKTAASCPRTPALVEAFEYMARGELVPDRTVLDLVRERAGCFNCPGGGFLLDGFPRTVPQAESLDAILAEQKTALEAVVSLEMPVERIVQRLGGRRTCPSCRVIYHVVARPPARQGMCDVCGTPLVQREDDRPEAIRVRMDTYRTSTTPLIDHYAGKGLLLPVSAEGTPEEIHLRLTAALDARLATTGS